MARAATAEMLARQEPPTALFGLNNQCAIGAARALSQAGRGHDLALIGFDDFDTADLLDPPLTVVAQDPEEMGREAVRLLFARLDGDGAPARTLVLPTQLIQRGSGEIAPRGVTPG